MSLSLAKLLNGQTGLNRAEVISLEPEKNYNDGRTKQCHADECDINQIMARFDRTGTISHLTKYQGTYADFSDFDFHEQTTKLTRGREIFDALPAEVRKEFGQSPAAFFEYVNDPANLDDLRKKLPALAAPGQQLPRVPSPTADDDKAKASADEPEPGPTPTPAKPPSEPPAASEAAT